jgi:hypothetical protein
MFNIKTDKTKKAEMPVGIDFPRTGFIGRWKAAMMYQVGWGVEIDLLQVLQDIKAGLSTVGEDVENVVKDLAGKIEGGNPFDVMGKSRKETFVYYFKDEEHAEELCSMLDDIEPRTGNDGKTWPWKPMQIWTFRAPIDTVQVENKEKFGPELFYSVDVVTLRSKKRRHGLHFLSLPGFVSALARAQGLEVPEFDLSALLVPDDKLILNEELESKLIGNAEIGYNDSAFFQNRAAIWAALGEEDPTKSHTIDAGTKLSTSSVQLSEILEAVESPWTEGYWARVIPVPSPKTSDAYGEGDERTVPNVPVLVEFFPDEAAAVATARAERGSGEEEEGEIKAQAGAVEGMPEVPGVWAEADLEAWTGQVKALKDTIGNVDLPMPVLLGKVKSAIKDLGYGLGATAGDVIKWFDHV